MAEEVWMDVDSRRSV